MTQPTRHPITINTAVQPVKRERACDAISDFRREAWRKPMHDGDSLYNSLQAQLRHQFSHGLLLPGVPIRGARSSRTWTARRPAAASSPLAPSSTELQQQQSSRPEAAIRACSFQPIAASRHLATCTTSPPHTEGFPEKLLGGWIDLGRDHDSEWPAVHCHGWRRQDDLWQQAVPEPLLVDPVQCSPQDGLQVGHPARHIRKHQAARSRQLLEYGRVHLDVTAVPSANTGYPDHVWRNFLPASSPTASAVLSTTRQRAPAVLAGSAAADLCSDAGAGYGKSGIGAIISARANSTSDMSFIKDTKIMGARHAAVPRRMLQHLEPLAIQPACGNDVEHGRPHSA